MYLKQGCGEFDYGVYDMQLIKQVLNVRAEALSSGTIQGMVLMAFLTTLITLLLVWLVQFQISHLPMPFAPPSLEKVYDEDELPDVPDCACRFS